MTPIDPLLLLTLSNWAHRHVGQFRPNGPGRQFGDLARLDAPPIWRAIKTSLLQQYQITDWILEPQFRDYCGYITEGGEVHPHQDPRQNGRDHIRINLVLSKPEHGGDPTQDGITIPLPEIGYSWRCDAGQAVHSCTMVHGTVPRIILSFGCLVPLEYRQTAEVFFR